jgi:hypothetical protein
MTYLDVNWKYSVRCLVCTTVFSCVTLNLYRHNNQNRYSYCDMFLLVWLIFRVILNERTFCGCFAV